LTTRSKSGPLALSDVRDAMLRKLAESALDAADAKILRLTPHTAVEAKALKLPATKAGFHIPYFDLNRKPLKFFRYRYMEDTRSGFQAAAGKKPLRYAQPSNTEVEVYMPPLVDWKALAKDPATPLVFTEGELKAACASKHGIPTLGLGGVWSFQSKKQGLPLISAFDAFEWKERTVYIVYDSDGATNPDVVAAEGRFAGRLLERGATVYIGRLPQPPAESELKKYGLDDYIVEQGLPKFRELVLETAYEYAASKALHDLNKRVVYVRNPGLVWDHDHQMRMAPGAFKEHAFSNLHYWEERVTKTGTTLAKVPAAKSWLEWEYRAECPMITFAPGQPGITEDGKLNSWTGWGLPEPMEGEVDEWHRLLAHIFGNDKESLRYFTQWAAYPLQNPGAKMHVAAAVWGPVHGSGKTLVGNTLQRIYGTKHSTELKDADLEDARFEWAENQQFIVADDITARGDRKFMRKLMTMITQHTLRMNPKYVASYTIEDRINYYFTSNDPDALFMDDQDRRFFVHEVAAGKFPDPLNYVRWMKSDAGAAALWWYLLNFDMTGFDPHAPAPDTIGKSSMIELGKSELGAWVHELKTNTEQVLARAKLRGDIFSTQQLHMLFDPNGDKKASVNALARELKRAGFVPPGNGTKLRLPDGRMVSTYAVRRIEHWKEAHWRDACAHYIENNPALAAPPAGKKF
jgi:hypothetical protein